MTESVNICNTFVIILTSPPNHFRSALNWPNEMNHGICRIRFDYLDVVTLYNFFVCRSVVCYEIASVMGLFSTETVQTQINLDLSYSIYVKHFHKRILKT